MRSRTPWYRAASSCGGRRAQSRGRAGAGAPLRRSALWADFPVLGLVARRKLAARPAVATLKQKSHEPVTALSRKQVRISPDAFEHARELAPGWDRYALEGLYIEWAASKDQARSEDARFLGWVKSYTKGKPAP